MKTNTKWYEEQIEEGNLDHDLEVYQACEEALDLDPEDVARYVDEHYEGSFKADGDFVEDLLESSGELPELPYYIYIDWERTSNDVMMDYFEEDGHYFRNA